MIDRRKLRRIHGEDLPLHVLEQDYIQALFISELYEISDSLVFKGGTFLKHAHGLDRFSEDLDFTDKGGISFDVFQDASKKLEKYGVDAEIDSLEKSTSCLKCRLRYRGPLFDGSDISRGSIDLEVSLREDLFLEPEWVKMFFPYPETRSVNALGMKGTEVFAEKLRALSMRNKARDLYDCWFLFKNNIEILPKLFERKMKVLDEKPIVKVSADEKSWEKDLKMFVDHVPNFQRVFSELVMALKDKGMNVETV